MGNYVSCTLSVHTASGSAGTAKVFLPDSSIRSVGPATSAAELMLEFPGYFLANSASLRIGSRFSALSADEDLEPGNAYAMFPMRRVGSTVNAADVAPIFIAVAGRKVVQRRRQAVPSSAVAPLPVAGEVGIGRRSSLCRSRRPVLETIAEETCAF